MDTEGGGGGGEPSIAQWLQENNLHLAIPKLTEQNMTVDELEALFEEDDLRQYLMDIGLDTGSGAVTRICSKIKKRVKSRNTGHPQSVAKIVRVIVSQDEEDAMAKLSAYKERISSMMGRLMTANDAVVENEKALRSRINAEFNHLIAALSNKQQSLLEELEDASQSKQAVITAKCQELAEREKAAESAMKTCDDMMGSGDIDKYERKKRVLSVVDRLR